MMKETLVKLNDLCDGIVGNHVSLKCPGKRDCPSPCRGCSFSYIPTTCIDDMWKHVARTRPRSCEVAIDEVMDMMKGI